MRDNEVSKTIAEMSQEAGFSAGVGVGQYIMARLSIIIQKDQNSYAWSFHSFAVIPIHKRFVV